ncbi:glycosyltransferase [candidate division WOR-3 bacterium]|nr:glycosyltransferase [candidate division WOR-3 bacterium]
MKVLLQNRFTLLQTGAGDRIHFFSLLNSLKNQGIDVSYSLSSHICLKEYDLVHLFNITQGDTYFQFKNAKKQKKPVVLTPIHIPKIYHNHSKKDKMKDLVKKNQILRPVFNFLKYPLSPHKRKSKNLEYDAELLERTKKELIKEADLLLPGSESEAKKITSLYGMNTNTLVIYPGIEDIFHQASPDLFTKKFGLKDFIISVGNIIPLKNQLNLIKALRDSNIPVVFIGGMGKNNQYNKLFKKDLSKNIIYLGKLNREMVASAFASASVGILISYSETTGRVNLEAGAAGAAVVCSDIPVNREYMKNYAYYCDPDSIKSIKNQVLKAFNKGPVNGTQQFIRENYTLEKYAEKVISAYKRLF